MPTPASKHDTVFQSDDRGTPDDWGNLSVDTSGNGNDLTDGGTKGHILAASAGDFTADPEFNVTLRFNHNTGDTAGYIFSRQIVGLTERHGILVGNASSTSLQFVVNNGIVGTMTMPGSFPASGGDDVLLSWSGRPNPLTTAAGNAMFNEVRCWNETDGIVEGITFMSTIPNTLATADVVFGARHGALGTQDYGGRVIDICYSTRFHSSTETYANWIATPATPTLTARAPIEVPVPDVASNFGAEDELVGPQYALAAASAIRNGALTLSPLVNTIPMLGQAAFDDGTPDVARWRSDNVPASGVDTWYWLGAFSYYPPAGRNFNRLKVHLQIQYTDPQGDDTQFRVYSMNAHPDSLELAIPGETPADTLEYYYSTVTIPAATDDGSGTTGGDWYAFDPIKVARAPGDEHTMICIAVLPASGGPDYRIRAVHVEPLIVDADSPGDIDGLDFG